MAVSFTVGGARGTFDGRYADEVADVLDNAFGAEGEWEGSPPLRYGEQADVGWSELQRRAIEELGIDAIPNLTALGDEGRGVYLPAQLQAISFPLSAGGTLRCASLLGLRHRAAGSGREVGTAAWTTMGCTNCCEWQPTLTTAGWPSHWK